MGNLFWEWAKKFESTPVMNKIKIARQSLEEERKRYDHSPYDLRIAEWLGWRHNRSQEQDN